MVQLGLGKTADLPCLDIAAISLEKALLWHSVEIRLRGRADRLSCLDQEAAVRLTVVIVMPLRQLTDRGALAV